MTDALQQSARTVAVVGGGISGLAAALRLVDGDPSCRIVLWEASARLGGVISTVHQDGFQIEDSADNFITTVPWGVRFAKRIGLGDALMQTNPAHRQTFVVRAGRLHKLPDGFLMMAPTRMWPLAVTPILSPWGKLRAACEYFIPPRRSGDDESMAAFVRRRLGREAFERLVEPLVSAVYAADMEKLSLDATLPQFRQMEQEHGSLIRAMRRRAAAQVAASDSGPRYSMFVTPRDGLSSMIDAAAALLPPDSVQLRTRAEKIEPLPGGHWLLTSAAGDALPCDAVILATPSHAAGRLLRAVDAELAADLEGIEHSGTAVLSVAYARSQIAHPLDAMGIVVPAVERSPLLACSFSSQKYAHRAPQGQVLLRIFAGGAQHPELCEMEDEKLRPLLLDALGRLLGIRGEPVFCRIAHWPRTMPQYHVGHTALVERIEARTEKLATLRLAGNAYHGVGIPHCIHSGQEAAESVLAALSESRS